MKNNKFFKALLFLVFLCSASYSQSSFTDSRDGKTYKTVKIGEQIWMAKNLDYAVEGSKCYSNNETHCNTYGRLYDWNMALKVCPVGWHLPSEDEWEELLNFLNGKKKLGRKNVADKLKSKSGWNSEGIRDFECWGNNCDRNEDGSGTDNYGFTALAGGTGSFDKSFSGAGREGYWWSAQYGSGKHVSTSAGGNAYSYYMQWSHNSVIQSSESIFSLFSVRCVKDK